MNSYLQQGIYEKDSYESIVGKLTGMFLDKGPAGPVRADNDFKSRTPAYAQIVR